MNGMAKRVFVGVLWRFLGRRNLSRLASFLSREARLEILGGVHEHGEPMVRRVVAANAPRVAHRGDGPRDDRIHVLDVGAHTGEWTLALLEAWDREGRDDVDVHAFEPASATFQRLRERLHATAGARHVTCNHLALSREPGRAELHVVHDLAGTNSLHRLHGFPATQTESVAVDTVAGYAERRGIDRVTLMKVDAEGHDLEVLAGAEPLFAEQRIEVVQFEYNACWIDARRFLRDAFDMLVPAGYRLSKLTRRGLELHPAWNPDLESFRAVNWVACLPRWLDRFRCFPRCDE